MRTLFCVSLDRDASYADLRSDLNGKQRILVARLIQKSVRILRPGDNLQNGIVFFY